jgi:hypothetical protein
MRIKGWVLLAVMIVVTVIYLTGEHFGCSGSSKLGDKPAGKIPPAASETK